MPSSLAYYRAYYHRNKARLLAQKKAYRLEHLESLRAQKRKYYRKNRKRIIAHVRAYAKRNKEKISSRNKTWRLNNPELFKERCRQNYLRNRDSILRSCRKYHRKNRAALLLKMKEKYKRHRRYRIEKQRKYYYANQESVKAAQRRKYWVDPEKRRAESLKYRRENLDRIRAYDRERSKRRGGEWTKRFYKKARQEVMAVLGRKCALCGYDERQDILQLDHKIPKCHTGASGQWSKVCRDALSDPSKFQILCPNCHESKTYADLYAGNSIGKSGISYRKKRAAVLALFGTRCYKCDHSDPHALQLDHKVPIFRHKRNYPATYEAARWPDRFQLSCANCHVIKTIEDLKTKKQLKVSVEIKHA